MTIDIMREVLGWCCVINITFLLWWFVMFMFARDWVYRFHGRWFKLSVEQFDSIHYAGIAFYKIAIFVFNLVPYIALGIAG
jgi:hypothetical protein